MNVETQTHRARPVRHVDPEHRRVATRTAFVARFIVLREGRRSKAHRTLEAMRWEEATTAEELVDRFRNAFIENGDKLEPVNRDLNRAYKHAQRSADYFAEQYVERATLSFAEALIDYQRSNKLLFGEDLNAVPRTGGWRIPGQNGANPTA